MTELVATGGRELHFQLVIHVLRLCDPVGDLLDRSLLLGSIDRSSQSDSTINRDDLHIAGVGGHSFHGKDFLADLSGGVSVSRALALIEGR